MMIPTGAHRHSTLIVGADSMIGAALSQAIEKAGVAVLKTSRRPVANTDTLFLELSQIPQGWHPPPGTDTVILCASINSLETCRQNPQATALININHTVEIAQRCYEKQCFVVFLSSNLVFDGLTAFSKPAASTNPQTEHGKQKARAEQIILSLGPNTAVIRFTKVFSDHMPLLQSWIHALNQGKPIHPFKDKFIAPLSLAFAVDVIKKITLTKSSGIFQTSGLQDISYADMALRLAKRLNVDLRLVDPIEAQTALPLLEHIPQHTTLDQSRLIEQLSMVIPSAEDTLNEILETNIKTYKNNVQPSLIC